MNKNKKGERPTTTKAVDLSVRDLFEQEFLHVTKTLNDHLHIEMSDRHST